jgi:hypothetical protein
MAGGGWFLYLFVCIFIQCRVHCGVFIRQYERNVRNTELIIIFLTFRSFWYMKTPHGTRHWIKHHTKSSTYSHHRHCHFKNILTVHLSPYCIAKSKCIKKILNCKYIVRSYFHNAICTLLLTRSKSQPDDYLKGSKHIAVWMICWVLFDGFWFTRLRSLIAEEVTNVVRWETQQWTQENRKGSFTVAGRPSVKGSLGKMLGIIE